MAGWLNGQPIVDLARIPRARWQRELTPLGREARYQSLRAVGLHPTHLDVVELWQELELADLLRRERLRAALHDPQRLAAAPRSRQVSMRLTPAEYAELCDVAAQLGVRPTTVVRQLVRNGIARMAYERRRTMAS